MDMNRIFLNDSLDQLKSMEENSIDLIVTDPPYGYSFMGKDWDKALPNKDIWRESLRVLKPGGFAFIMSAPRTDVQSRLGQDLESVGFVTAFTPVYWTYSSGFPKAYNMGQSAEKKLTIGVARRPDRDLGNLTRNRWSGEQEGKLFSDTGGKMELTKDESKALEKAYGGFQPKPAVEVILVVMKPLKKKTYVEQALDNNKGITWLDNCKMPDIEGGDDRFMSNLLVQDNLLGENSKYFDLDQWWGRFRNNLPDRVREELPWLFVKKPNKNEKESGLDGFEKKVAGSYNGNVDTNNTNSLGANPSRPPSLRSNTHPTVKPIELMSYLVQLGSAEGEVVLDPFVGSGTTCISCVLNKRNYIGIEIDESYYDIAQARVEYYKDLANQ